VSHCGLAAAQEALYFGKPLLCIPLFADQPDVAARVADAGAGLSLDKNHLTVSQIGSFIQMVLFGHAGEGELVDPKYVTFGSAGKHWRNNHSYALSARRVGSILKEAGGTLRAAKAIENAIQVGTIHMRTLDLDRPWHEVFLLDVYAVYLAMFFVLMAVCRIAYVWFLLLWLHVFNFAKRMGIARFWSLSGKTNTNSKAVPNRQSSNGTVGESSINVDRRSRKSNSRKGRMSSASPRPSGTASSNSSKSNSVSRSPQSSSNSNLYKTSPSGNNIGNVNVLGPD
jgi:hypothetical protein